MSEKISWNVTARADAGPAMTASGAIVVDAYDKLEVTIKTGPPQSVNIAPGNWSSVLFLALNPKQPSDQLTYQVNGANIAVNGPHFLVGGGAVALLGAGPATLNFTNGVPTDATIDILVGRKAA